MFAIYVEGFVEVTIAIYLGLEANLMSTNGEVAGMVVVWFSIGICLIIALLLVKIIWFSTLLDLESSKQLYGSLYEGINVKNKSQRIGQS